MSSSFSWVSGASLVVREDQSYPLAVGGPELVHALNIQYGESILAITNGDDLASFQEQEKAYSDFLAKIDSPEKLHIAILWKPNLHRLIIGAKKVWFGRWKDRDYSFEFDSFTPHPYLTPEGRAYILSHHEYKSESRYKKETRWLSEIAHNAQDSEDLCALARNYTWIDSQKLRLIVAETKWLPDTVQFILAEDPDREVRIALAKNPALCLKITTYFLDSGDEDLRLKTILNSRYVSIRYILEYWEKYRENYYFIRVALGKEDCPVKIINQIYEFLTSRLWVQWKGTKTDLADLIDLANQLGSHPRLTLSKRAQLFTKKQTAEILVRFWSIQWSFRPTGRDYSWKPPQWEWDNWDTEDDIPF